MLLNQTQYRSNVMSKHLHFIVPDEIYDAWKQYAADETIKKEYYSATTVFCDLPELRQYLANPVMVIKRARNTITGRKPKLRGN